MIGQHLTFWTVVGNLVLGVLAGLLIGVLVREATRLARPARVALPDGGVCPVCNRRTLRRVRYSLHQRIVGAVTGHWPYACRACGWKSTSSVRAKERPLARVPEPGPPMTFDGNTVVAVKPEHAFMSDAAEIKGIVLRHLAMLKSGEVATRAKYCLSESTSFGLDGGRLISLGFDHHAGPLDTDQMYDLRCRDLKVYTHHDTAIATAYLIGTVSRPDGASIPVSGRSSWVLVRQDGGWKLAHTHLSPLIRST